MLQENSLIDGASEDSISIIANDESIPPIPIRSNAFLDWLAGITGITTTEKPIVLDPPKDCSSCSMCSIILTYNKIHLIFFLISLLTHRMW